MPRQRIQKILAAAGFGSRRACETLVADGHVEIDGRVVTDLPIVVDPAESRITVDGKPVRGQRYVYFLLNKPKGYFCTNSDPDGRRRAIDLMVGVRERVFPVGRLDAETMGLLLMTNDGDLSQKLTHPRFGTPKTYRAEVRGRPEPAQLEKLRKGVWLSDGKTGPADISIVHASRQKSVLEITLREGRNREIRRMLARLGHSVTRLTRIKMGRLSIKRVPLGGFRALTADEVKYLHRLAESGEAQSSSRRARRGSKSPSDSPKRNRPTRGDADSRRSAGKKAPKSEPAQKRIRTAGGPQEKETVIPAHRGRKKRRIIMPD